MEIFETLNISNSFEDIEQHIFTHPTAPSLKSSALSQDRGCFVGEEKIIGIISANLNSRISRNVMLDCNSNSQYNTKGSLFRGCYKSLKSKYLASETQKSQLQEELRVLSTTKCHMCEVLRSENKSTKEALEEAIQLSSILLNELQRLSEFN